MAHNHFNANMLDLARGARGLTQADVAKASGISQAMLSKVENRLLTPNNELAEKIARALGFPVEFFFQEDRTHGFPHYHYRKRASLGSKALAKIVAIINIRRQHIQKMIKSYDMETTKIIPVINLDEKELTPSDAARMVREYWMLPRGPVDNLVAVIESAGGIIIVTDFGTPLLDGISFRIDGLPPIFIMNSEVPADRFRFSLAHELGHMVMHAIPNANDEQMENEADDFASALLMPATEVRPYLMPPTIAKFASAKKYWKVSIKSMIRRAKDLKIISQDSYRRLSISYAQAGYNRGEPFPLEMEKANVVSSMVRYHMTDLSYSAAELAKILHLHEDDFRKIYLRRSHLELVVSR